MLRILLCILLFSSVTYAQGTDSAYADENFDQSLFRTLNGHRTGLLDITIALTEKPVTIPLVLIPASLYTSALISDNYYDENSSYLLAVSSGVGIGITSGLKYVFKRKRPVESMDGIYFDKNFLRENDRYSFPSGHATVSFNTAASLTLRYPDNPYLITGFYLHALAVSFGRIYIGAHYPGDVLTGALIGTGSAVLVFALRKELIELKADVFHQKDRKEIGSDKTDQYVALGSLIAMDLFNYFILGQQSKITKNMRIEFGSVGNTNTLNFTYSF